MTIRPTATLLTAALLLAAGEANPQTIHQGKPAPAAMAQAPGRAAGGLDVAGGPAERVFAALAAKPRLMRSTSLQDMGFLQPIIFTGADAERQIYFGVPREVPLIDAQVTLAGAHLKVPNGRMTMLAELGGRPVSTIDFEGGEGSFARALAIPPAAHQDGFLRLGVKFTAMGTGDRCTDQRSIGNVVSLDPATRLTYQVDPRDIRSVRAAWGILPYDAKILVSGGPLTTEQYDAAARMALAVHASGRKPVFVALPDIGSWVPTGSLRVAEELGDVAIFRKFIDAAGQARLDNPADRGAYMLLMALSGQSMGDIAIDSAAIQRTVDDDIEALRAKLGQEAPAVLAAMDRWLEVAHRRPKAGGGENLSLAFMLGFPQLQLDTETAPMSAALMGSRWHRLARSETLVVRAVKGTEHATDHLPLSELSGSFAPQAITDYGEWAVSFSAAQLPPERWPTTVDLEMRVAPDSADVAPVASVLLNDTLLRAQRVDPSSSVFRMTAEIPRYLLGANNTLKIALQRGPQAGDCKVVPRGYLAQLLPTSRVSLAKSSIDGQFFGLLPRFADAAAVYIPADYLKRPVEALPFTVAFMRALSITSSSLRLGVVDQAQPFKPDHAFVAFDSALPGVRAGVSVKDDRLTLTGDDKEVLLDMTGAGDVAVAQIGEIGGTYGVLVDTRPGGSLPPVKVDQLTNGDVAVVDSTGVIAELGAAERKAAAVERALYEPAALAYRYREYLIAGFSIIFALVLMRAIRSVVTARKRNRERGKGEA